MLSSLDIFDYVQTVFICVCLIFTIPLACYVYYKLIFNREFSENHTFKLIAINGITDILNCLIYLFAYQLTTYPFMREFYIFVKKFKLVTAIAVINVLLGGVGLHTAFFISCNRLKSIVSPRGQSKDSLFFYISISISFLLALPGVFDFCFFTQISYIELDFGNTSVFIPSTVSSNEVLLTIASIIRYLCSLATLVTNIVLCFLIFRERKLINISARQKFKGEKGLARTSIVSHAFYIVYFANNRIARYFDVKFCGYAQWLFLGLYSITPFWCLILFTPSVRRIFSGTRKQTSTVHTLTNNS